MSSKSKKVTFQKEVRDFQTGEIVQSETEFQLPREPNFVKLYIDDLILLKDIPQWVSNVLYSLLKHMNYQNEIILNSTIKRRIAADLDIVPKTIDNSLVTFVKKGIFTRQDVGVYKANPYLFGKGEWKDIHKIRVKIGYGEGVREITADIVKEELEPAALS